MKVININTDAKKFFKQYLNIIRPLLVPRLSNGELNILSELLYLNYLHKDVSPGIRGKLIFDYDNKIAIVDSLDSSLSTVNNAITSLRKKGYIAGRELKKDIIVLPNESFKLGFNFTIKDNEGMDL